MTKVIFIDAPFSYGKEYKYPYIFPKELGMFHSLKKVEPFDLWPPYLA